MQLVNLPDIAAYILVGWVIVYSLPSLGRRVLAFLRDRDRYRAGE